jgi:CheY-like chemotaxis protein
VAGLPAAAVTAYAGAQERDRALAAGFQMHLAKPILPEALAHAVAKLAAVESA